MPLKPDVAVPTAPNWLEWIDRSGLLMGGKRTAPGLAIDSRAGNTTEIDGFACLRRGKIRDREA
jgi:hypothetical protein